MQMLTLVLRLFRKKVILTTFIGLLLFIILGNILYFGSEFFESEDNTVLHLRKLNQPFNWNIDEEEVERDNITDTALFTCRNSVQGRTVLADDKGYICPRSEILGNGCCNLNSSLTERHVCWECETETQCCGQYEHCISCCLRPDQRDTLQKILSLAAQTNNVLFVSVSDHFELCLAKCRTSSDSVQHENTYRNKERKYCFGSVPPPTLAASR